MSATKPCAQVLFSTMVLEPDFLFTRERGIRTRTPPIGDPWVNDAAALFNGHMNAFTDIMLDGTRTGGGQYVPSLMVPIVTNRAKLRSLIELVQHFLQYNRKVTIYGPGPNTIDDADWARLDRTAFAQRMDFLFDWLNVYRGDPRFRYCGDALGNARLGSQRARFGDYLYQRGHNVVVEGRAWEGTAFYGWESVSTSASAGREVDPANPWLQPTPDPERHAITFIGNGPVDEINDPRPGHEDHYVRKFPMWRAKGHPIYLPAHEIIAGRAGLYLPDSDPPKPGGGDAAGVA